MSAESERVFSGARRTISWTRARLSGPVIEPLECIKHWQRAGVVDEDFIDEIGDETDVEVIDNDV